MAGGRRRVSMLERTVCIRCSQFGQDYGMGAAAEMMKIMSEVVKCLDKEKEDQFQNFLDEEVRNAVRTG